MVKIDRRSMLAAGLVGIGGAGLAGCTRSSDQQDVAGAGSGTLRWWDQFAPLQALYDATFAEFAKTPDGIEVEHTVYNASEMGQALQLARKSNQMPDVWTNVVGVPDGTLVADGWAGPLPLDDATLARIQGPELLDGVHVFDGDVYTFPLFSSRQHATLTWFDTDVVERAGGDPVEGPTTWDEFRALARAMTTAGTPGWVVGLSFTERLGTHVVDLAQAAGAQLSSAGGGSFGMADPATGDYVFDSEPFVLALEFLKSLVDDGSMLPASTSLDARSARARWAAGGAGLFFDGPWNAGALQTQFPDITPRLGVGQVPTPQGPLTMAKGAAAGVFWLTEGSGAAQQAGALLGLLTDASFAQGLAEAMDQPPADTDVVATADVLPAYARAVELFRAVTIAPSAVARNPAVSTVIAGMSEVRPDLGEIAQGYLGGDVDDVRAALADYTGKVSAERDRSTADAQAAGLDVDQDDWVFPDHVPGQDYAPENYS